MKPFTVMGVAAACVACCALPALVPWIVGGAGLAIVSQNTALLGLALGALGVVWLAIYRRRKTMDCSPSVEACASASCSSERGRP